MQSLIPVYLPVSLHPVAEQASRMHPAAPFTFNNGHYELLRPFLQEDKPFRRTSTMDAVPIKRVSNCRIHRIGD